MPLSGRRGDRFRQAGRSRGAHAPPRVAVAAPCASRGAGAEDVQRTVIGEGADDHGRPPARRAYGSERRPCSPGPKGSKDRAKGVRPFRLRFPRQPARVGARDPGFGVPIAPTPANRPAAPRSFWAHSNILKNVGVWLLRGLNGKCAQGGQIFAFAFSREAPEEVRSLGRP